MTTTSLAQRTAPFMDHLEQWYRSLEPFHMAQEVRDPARAAVFSADMVVGFCSQGALASPRVRDLIPAVVNLFVRAHAHGVRHFILAQDTHSEDAPEFTSFPPHCVRGTEESPTVPELRSLPFSSDFTVIEKDSLHPALGTDLDAWLGRHNELRDLIVVGDCTDLCTYTMAMHLRLRANTLGLTGQRVIVPANAVDTFDMPLETARDLGTMPHPGDVFHNLFLYHMALNGVQVVSEVS